MVAAAVARVKTQATEQMCLAWCLHCDMQGVALAMHDVHRPEEVEVTAW